jgi:pyruvate dehydrogenase complex dehydrogenase (E1) component
MQYLMGNQTRERMENFRGFGGVQSYPGRTKDIDDVDFSTGSVGLGVAVTSFASIIQDYITAKSWGGDVFVGRMVALVGDAELDEGSIYEALQEGWKTDLRNTWWIIDYNRQSLDGIVREGLFAHVENIFDAFGWDVARIKYGGLQRAAFQEPGGGRSCDWIDACPNQQYAAPAFMDDSALAKRVDANFRQEAIDGAYWLRKPGPDCAIVIAYQGAVAPEAIKAAGMLSEGRRDIGVLAVTSADRLNASRTAAQRARSRGNTAAQPHVETLMSGLPSQCKIITVIDAHPATPVRFGGGRRSPINPDGRRALRPNRHDRRPLWSSRYRRRGHRRKGEWFDGWETRPPGDEGLIDLQLKDSPRHGWRQSLPARSIQKRSQPSLWSDLRSNPARPMLS